MVCLASEMTVLIMNSEAGNLSKKGDLLTGAINPAGRVGDGIF